MQGLTIYPSVPAAIKAGVRILTFYPDSEGFLRGDVKTQSGKLAAVLVVCNKEA